jgi:divalent metal cation (Fe/Co/Zn/Cd) transporter
LLGSMFDDLKQKIDGMLKLAVAGAVAAAAGTVAFFCFAVALFLWVERGYGTLEAWLALGALFIGVAAVAGIIMIAVRRPARRVERPRESPSHVARMLQEPAVMLAGLQVLRLLGARNVLPVILLGAVAGGLLMGRNGHSHGSRHDPAGHQQGVEAD